MKLFENMTSKIMIKEPSKEEKNINENRLENILRKKKLQKNPPYQLEKIESQIADHLQLKKSIDRSKKFNDLIPPQSESCQFSLDSLDVTLKEKILSSNFWEYVKENQSTPTLLNYGYSTMEEKLVYTGDLSAPITRLLGDMKNIATKVFRLIYKICVDRTRLNLPFYKIRRLIEILMNNSAEIKDECFLQLIKQTRNNAYLDPNANEWKLMGILVSFVTPSEYFIYHFLNFLNYTFSVEKFEEARIWAMFVLMRTIATNKSAERMVLPFKEEIIAIEERKKLKIEINYLNGGSEVHFIESFTTVENLKEQIITKYQLGDNLRLNFGILEFCKKDGITEETYVDDNVKILDVLSSWTNEYEFQCKKDEIEGYDANFRLYFKIRFDFETTSIEHEVLKYFECCRSFQKNRYETMARVSFIRLLALNCRIWFGDVNEEKSLHIHKNFKHLSPKLDRELIDPEEYNKVIENVFTEYISIKKSSIECMKEFLAICSKFALFSCELYPVIFFHKDDEVTSNVYELPKQLMVGVKSGEILLIGMDYVVLKKFSYAELMKWGFNLHLFILLVQEPNNEVPIKLSFKTRMGADMVYRMNTFVDLKLGKQIQTNSVMVNENVTREVYQDKFFKKVNSFVVRSLTLEEN